MTTEPPHPGLRGRHIKRGSRRGHRWRSNDKHGGCVFFWLVAVFGVLTMLIIGGLTLISALIGFLLGGENPFGDLIPVACCIAIILPMMGMAIASRSYRTIAQPLSDLINAAESVADGDFSVRVPETASGHLGELSQTFNRMIAEVERIDEQRRNLTADVAHELRTPLHIIQGNLEGILDGVYQPTPEHINSILDDTRLLARLIEDLRTLSMAESGQLSLNLENISVQDLLTDVVTSFSGQAEVATITLCIDTDHPLAGLTLNADLRRLNQILSNLIMNAIRHTPSGGNITLCGEHIGSTIRLSVTDNGYGISPDDLPHIFDRFWRGDKSRTHKEGVGGGLGLAITQQLIELHGGRIEVASQVGQGTTFTLIFPAPS